MNDKPYKIYKDFRVIADTIADTLTMTARIPNAAEAGRLKLFATEMIFTELPPEDVAEKMLADNFLQSASEEVGQPVTMENLIEWNRE
jgi:hypothetical protein